MKVLSIDIGIVNFAFTFWVRDELKDFDNIDITSLRKESEQKCIAVYMKNLFENIPYFKSADFILIERQPFSGIVAVQEIILYHYNKKCILISPIKMHKYIGIDHLDYNNRKIKTIEFARPYLEKYEKYRNLIRKHDVADSLCIYIYWKNTKKFEDNPFETFEYTQKIFENFEYKKKKIL
tara:strand:- start:1829 stop:2368 length:540 start_codon:yes stop_codon:yes gene_type:complete